ncbi:MAG: metal-dependent transcriptional regulator [candidate division WOR-3 bacterium]
MESKNLSGNREDYLATLFLLSTKRNRAIRTKELADDMGVSNASVTEMVRKLSDEGFVEIEPYYGFSLTNRGVLEALRVMSKHNLLESFLENTLGLSKGDAHTEAHKLEHVVSDEALGRMGHLLKSAGQRAQWDKLKSAKIVSLSDIPPGKKARIVFSKLKASRTLDRLNAMGLVPETEIRVLRRLKKGPMIVQVRGSEIALDRDIASSFYVEK